MFKNLSLSEAALYSAIITIICITIATIIHIRLNKFCRENEKEVDPAMRRKTTAVKAIVLLIFATAGLYIGNLISIVITYRTALSHGMETDGQCTLSYGEMQTLNKHSIEETRINIDELKGKAVIFVRYDCPDCIALHDQLNDIQDMTFLSSRSDLGKAAREIYDIDLTEVPQGAYIDINGNATTVDIICFDNNTITLDLQQIAILREMANRRKSLSNE